MTLLLDTNVVIDFLSQRPLYLDETSRIIDSIQKGHLKGVVAFHSVTTIYYLVEKADGHRSAIDSIDWLLSMFTIASAGQELLVRARALDLPDFEDAVVVATAESEKCDAIVTRDKQGFARSPVPVYDPSAFILKNREFGL
ncbi:MAG: PIN domain-containing protein [Candidatus Hydrogenedentes bacterium]|nr:PIN domain-containing protein [Candidatus Hydrogenedentota bacterium]